MRILVLKNYVIINKVNMKVFKLALEIQINLIF